MKIRDEITKDMLFDVIMWFVGDLQGHIDDSKKKCIEDPNNEFEKQVVETFQHARDVYNRQLTSICDYNDRDELYLKNGVTREILISVVSEFISFLEQIKLNAKKEKDSSTETMYNFVLEMLMSRLSVVCE